MLPSSGQPPRYWNEEAADPAPGSAWGKLLHWVPEGSTVLDVGCGHGAFGSALTRLKHCHVTGIEIDVEAARNAGHHCERVITGDIAAILEHGELQEHFQVVVAADILEHLIAPETVLVGLARHLETGDVVLASIHNVKHLSVLVVLSMRRLP